MSSNKALITILHNSSQFFTSELDDRMKTLGASNQGDLVCYIYFLVTLALGNCTLDIFCIVEQKSLIGMMTTKRSLRKKSRLRILPRVNDFFRQLSSVLQC